MWYQTSGRVKILFFFFFLIFTLVLNFSNIYISLYSCGLSTLCMNKMHKINYIYIYIYIRLLCKIIKCHSCHLNIKWGFFIKKKKNE